MTNKLRSAGLVAFFLLAACSADQTEQQIAAVPVRTEVARRQPFTPILVFAGVIRASETIPLVVERTGTLRYPLRFAGGLRSGEKVSAGELIAEVTNPQADYLAVESKLKLEAADARFERARRSHAEGIVSSAEFSSADADRRLAHEAFTAAGKDVARLKIRAVRTGLLSTTRTWAAGITVDAGTTLGQIVAGGAPVIESSVPGSDREDLAPGLRVRAHRGSWKGDGVVREVAPVVDEAGTLRIVSVLLDQTLTPPPGTGVDLEVELSRRPDVITVPEDAVVAGGEGATVYILGSNDVIRGAYRVKRIVVETGRRSLGRIEIRSGVRDGDRVVIRGADSLADGSSVIEAGVRNQ